MEPVEFEPTISGIKSGVLSFYAFKLWSLECRGEESNLSSPCSVSLRHYFARTSKRDRQPMHTCRYFMLNAYRQARLAYFSEILAYGDEEHLWQVYESF